MGYSSITGRRGDSLLQRAFTPMMNVRDLWAHLGSLANMGEDRALLHGRGAETLEVTLGFPRLAAGLDVRHRTYEMLVRLHDVWPHR